MTFAVEYYWWLIIFVAYMKLNYYRATEALISFKDQFEFIKNKKNDLVLSYLNSVELDYDKDEIGVPDVTKICEAIGLPRNKVHPILFQAYIDLLESLATHPSKVTDCVHAIYIRHHEQVPWKGKRTKKEQQADEVESERSFWGEFRLPVTPRLGESISLDFIDWNTKYSRGIVTEVQHEISGLRQRIVLYVHPTRNYFWQWKRLEKEDRERDEWLEYLERESTKDR
jgi:hypothetical protein